MKDVPDTAKLIRIVASQSSNRVESTTIHGGRYGQSANKAMRELRRVHFPGSALEEMNSEGKQQPNLTALLLRGRNRKSRKVTNQSRIIWVISTSKPFKLSVTDGIVFALLQHRVTLLMTHLCYIFRACLATEYIGLPKAWRQSRWHLTLNPGSLTIQRLRHTIYPHPGCCQYSPTKTAH